MSQILWIEKTKLRGCLILIVNCLWSLLHKCYYWLLLGLWWINSTILSIRRIYLCSVNNWSLLGLFIDKWLLLIKLHLCLLRRCIVTRREIVLGVLM